VGKKLKVTLILLAYFIAINLLENDIETIKNNTVNLIHSNLVVAQSV
jgi:hypothetical protein